MLCCKRDPGWQIRSMLTPSWCEFCDRLEQPMIPLAEHPITVAIANRIKGVKSQISLQTHVIASTEAQNSVEFGFLVFGGTQVTI